MKAFVFFLTLLTLTPNIRAEEVFRIEIGSDYKKYSDADLKRRVWELERAVDQLQHRIFQLETTKPLAAAATWLCTISAMGDSFTGTGPTKPVASAEAFEKCKAKRGDGFFCKDAKCEQ